jgi:hypothetical protein
VPVLWNRLLPFFFYNDDALFVCVVRAKLDLNSNREKGYV